MATAKWVQLYKNKALGGDSGTETFPIKRTDQILELELRVRAKNGATANAPDAIAMATVESSITKIQVNSGSAIFKSYTGEVCRKIATYRNGKVPYTMITEVAGGTYAPNDPSLGWHEAVFPINFNLKEDPMGTKTGIIMPAPLYDSLDLVLEYNFSISATVGFVTGGANHVFDLYALVMPKEADEVMKGKKILVEAKKADYTTVAGGDYAFKLTLDANRFMRQIYTQVYENGVGEGVDVTDVTLRVDNDVTWASKWDALQNKNAADVDLDYFWDIYQFAQTATDELWTRVPAPKALITPGTSPTTAPFFTTLANGDKVTVTTDAASDVNLIRIESDVLPAMAVIDFDTDSSLMNMQYQGVKDFELTITQGASGAGATVQVIEQSVAKPWGY